jgi:hypothetical protein
MFLNRHVLVKLSPAETTVLSGYVTSVIKLAPSQFKVGVAAGASVGIEAVESGTVGKTTGVKVAAAEDADGAVGDSTACTVKAAAVITAAGSCWEDGRLHARLAAMIAMPASTVENLRMGSSNLSSVEILMQSVKLHTPVLS